MNEMQLADPGTEFFVACLCAAWCGTCREYRPAFEALAANRPGIGFVWVDVEDQSEYAGDLDVENFPTLVIQRGHDVLFAGPTLPEAGILARLLDSFAGQSVAEAVAYAQGSPERRGWQGLADVRSRLEKRV